MFLHFVISLVYFFISSASETFWWMKQALHLAAYSFIMAPVKEGRKIIKSAMVP